MLNHILPLFSNKPDHQQSEALPYIYEQARNQGSIQLYPPGDIPNVTGLYRDYPAFLHPTGNNSHATAIIHTVVFDGDVQKVVLHGIITGPCYPTAATCTLSDLPLRDAVQLADYLHTHYYYQQILQNRKKHIYGDIDNEFFPRHNYNELENEQVLNVYEYPGNIFIVEVLEDNTTQDPPDFILDLLEPPLFFTSLQSAEEGIFSMFANKMIQHLPAQSGE